MRKGLLDFLRVAPKLVWTLNRTQGSLGQLPKLRAGSGPDEDTDSCGKQQPTAIRQFYTWSPCPESPSLYSFLPLDYTLQESYTLGPIPKASTPTLK